MQNSGKFRSRNSFYANNLYKPGTQRITKINLTNNATRKKFISSNISFKDRITKSISREKSLKINKPTLTSNNSLNINHSNHNSERIFFRNKLINQKQFISKTRNNLINPSKSYSNNIIDKEDIKFNSNLNFNDLLKTLSINTFEMDHQFDVQILGEKNNKNINNKSLSNTINNENKVNSKNSELENNNSLEENMNELNNENKNNLINNENDTINQEENDSFLNRKIHKKGSFHLIHKSQRNEKLNDLILKKRPLIHYLTPRTMNTSIYNKHQNFNSSNDAISTDTNLRNNKTFTTTNSNLDNNLSFNKPLKNNFPFIQFKRNLQIQKEEYEDNEQKLNSENGIDYYQYDKDIENDNDKINCIINHTDNSKKENPMLYKFSNTLKKRNKDLNYLNTFNIGEEQSLEEINLLKGRLLNNTDYLPFNDESNEFINNNLSYDFYNQNNHFPKKNVKRQLSKIPEFSLYKEEKRRNSLFDNSNNLNLIRIKEIMDKKIEIKNTKRSITPHKKGFKIMKKIIKEIEKNKNDNVDLSSVDFVINASNSHINIDKEDKANNNKKTNNIESLSSLFFFNLRTNSISYSMKDFSERIHRKFLDLTEKKLINFLQNEIYSKENNVNNLKNKLKEDLFIKSFTFIKCNYQDNNIKSYSFISKKIDESVKYIKDVQSDKIPKKYFLKFETENTKLLDLKQIKIKNNFRKCAIEMLLDKYFKILLYEHIFKGRYLDSDLGDEKKKFNDKLISHFGIIKNKPRKISMKKKLIFPQHRPSIILSFKTFKFFNYLLFRDNPIYFEKNIDFISILKPLFIEQFQRKRNTKITIPFFQNRKYSIYHSKHQSRKMLKRKTSLISNLRKQSSNTLLTHKKIKEEEKIQVLTKSFYERKRDSFVNDIINTKKINEGLKKSLEARKRHSILFVSPINYTEEKTYSNDIPLRKEDKNYTIYKTMKIKNELLKNCSNYSEVLFLHIKDNNIHGFRKVFEKHKANTEIRDNEGNTLLNIATQCDFKKAVIYLLNLGANPNSQNYKLNSPLHYALSYQNFELADILIKHGANENLKNLEGLTPWQCLNSYNTIL